MTHILVSRDPLTHVISASRWYFSAFSPDQMGHLSSSRAHPSVIAKTLYMVLVIDTSKNIWVIYY